MLVVWVCARTVSTLMIMTGCIRVYGYVFGLFVGGVLFLFLFCFFELVVLALCFLWRV